MSRLAALLIALLTAALLAISGSASAHAAGATRSPGTRSIDVRVDPRDASVKLGETLPLHVTLTNNGAEATPELVLHLDVTDPTKSTSVDPEDWTSTLTKQVGAIPPGDTRVVEWIVQPISSGDFVAYAVALIPRSRTIAASNAATIRVEHQQTLNPHGILGVALGVPAALGALLLVQQWMARRPRNSDQR
jgi:hypothetical protein